MTTDADWMRWERSMLRHLRSERIWLALAATAAVAAIVVGVVFTVRGVDHTGSPSDLDCSGAKPDQPAACFR